MFSGSVRRHIFEYWGEPVIYYRLLHRHNRPRFDIDMRAFDSITELPEIILLTKVIA